MSLAGATCLYFSGRQKGRKEPGIQGQESRETESSRTGPRGWEWGPRGAFPGTRRLPGRVGGGPAAPRVPLPPPPGPALQVRNHVSHDSPRRPFSQGSFLPDCLPASPAMLVASS